MAKTQQRTAMKDLEGYLTPAQVDRMILSAQPGRDRVLIRMCWHTGRRISEVLKVKKRDIDFYKSLIKFSILKKKSDLKKLKPVDSFLLHELKVYTTEMLDDDYIFPSPYIQGSHLSRTQAYRIIRKAAEDAGIFNVGDKPPHPHHLRHSFAVNFLRETKNPTIAIKVLQMILEHSSIEMTSNYLQFSQEDIRIDLEKIFGGQKK